MLRGAAPTSRAMVVAVMSIGSLGPIIIGTANATGFAHVLEVSAALFALGA